MKIIKYFAFVLGLLMLGIILLGIFQPKDTHQTEVEVEDPVCHVFEVLPTAA